MADDNPKQQLDQLGIAVGLLAHGVGALNAAVSKFIYDPAPTEELRKDLLYTLNLVQQATGAVQEMFPAPEGGVLH